MSRRDESLGGSDAQTYGSGGCGTRHAKRRHFDEFGARIINGLLALDSSPPLSVQLPPEFSADDMGTASAVFGRIGAPSRAPTTDTANYDQMSYGQLRELREQRG